MNRLKHCKSDIRFTAILTACVGVSVWLAHYIPADVFDRLVSPALVACTASVALLCCWIIARHTDGLRFRRAWAWALLIWGLADLAYLVLWAALPERVMDMSASQLSPLELLLGNLLGWVLLLYPTEALRPGWLNWKRTLLQLLPLLVLVSLDYAFPQNLRFLISLYPIVLASLLFSHLRAYKSWCEENYSTLDDIDVRWIARYLIMLVLVGVVFIYMCASHSHTRGFTQLWLPIFLFAYATEQILFRKDPWTMVRHIDKGKHQESGDLTHAELRKKLEDWMTEKKPYLNPGFQLADLGQVLAVDRTDLSLFIDTVYGCSFYQFANRYRVEEAKSLKRKHPELSINELATRSGFSSVVFFSSVFTRETGLTPREWFKQNNLG